MSLPARREPGRARHGEADPVHDGAHGVREVSSMSLSFCSFSALSACFASSWTAKSPFFVVKLKTSSVALTKGT